MKKQKGFTVIEILTIVIFLFIVPSWFKNAYNLTQCNFESPYKAEFFYGLGLFTPIFVVTAWIDIED